MGLAGRRTKQRIGHDPRNTSWADDASRFGSAYLSKMGWDASKGVGLGVVGNEGRVSHVKVLQKLDMLGIGANRAAAGGEDVEGWKQARDFDALLRRLNESASGEVEEGGENVVSKETSSEGIPPEKEKKEKRRQTDNEGDESSRSKKRRKTSPEPTLSSNKEDLAETTKQPSLEAKPVHAPRPMAHRAKFLASKRLAAVSDAAMSEILGISPSSTPRSVSTPTLASTPVSQQDSGHETPETELQTTSTKSVADYFKDKLAALSTVTRSTPASPSPKNDFEQLEKNYDAPRLGIGAGIGARQRVRSDEYPDDRPAFGIGAMKSVALLSSVKPETSGDAEQASDTERTQAERKAAKAARKQERAERRARKAERRAKAESSEES